MSYCDEGFIIFLTQRQFAMARNVGVGGVVAFDVVFCLVSHI